MNSPWLESHPHRRRNILTGRWVLVSPHRMARPWQGREESASPTAGRAYDPECYLCPGNERAEGHRNPSYEGVHIFDNDFPALKTSAPLSSSETESLLRAQPVEGLCRVICYSPHHELHLGSLGENAVSAVIDAWAQQSRELHERYESVQIFENRGSMMGCSNPHPHGQIWAANYLPDEPLAENLQQKRHYQESGRLLLDDYLAAERETGHRTVLENDAWTVLVPFWAVWPFETLLVCKRDHERLEDLESIDRLLLARILRDLLRKYDAVFDCPFPYSMGWHGAPSSERRRGHWRLHAHFYPPLLRSQSIRKFFVGFEMLGEPQRDITPERAADILRSAGGS